MQRLFIAILLILLSSTSLANPLHSNGISISNIEYWGEYSFEKFGTDEVTYEWVFNKSPSTLIIIKSECKSCKPLDESNVAEINTIDDFNVSAFLISHKYGNGIYQIHEHKKKHKLFNIQNIS